MRRGKLINVISLILVYLTGRTDVAALPSDVEHEDKEVTELFVSNDKYILNTEKSKYRAMIIVGKSQVGNIAASTHKKSHNLSTPGKLTNYSEDGGTSGDPSSSQDLLFGTGSNNDTECVLKLSPESIGMFRHEVYYSDASFVYLNLQGEEDVKITGGERVVGENIWVWTFWGKEGSLEFLNWPIEFGIWSLGLLTSFVIKEPMTMELARVSGNCSNLEVGVPKNDKIISNALVALGEEMMKFNTDKYGPSFYCYKTRKLIPPEFAYILCMHIVCPVEALRYDCCSYYYNTTTQARKIDCIHQVFEYEVFSWILPTVTSVILFAFFPLLLLYLCHWIADDKHVHRHLHSEYQEIDTDNKSTFNDLVLHNEHHPVTLSKTLLVPVRLFCSKLLSNASGPCRNFLRRIFRFVFPFLSLTFIAFQVCLDYLFLYDFVLTSISKGVPMGFRSIIAGYDESKTNFLPYLGGPFVAVGIYLLITCFMLLLPTSVSGLLLSGVPDNNVDESTSPLMVKLSSLERYGSRKIMHTHGFYKLYSVFTAQFFMLINATFWEHALSVQIERWKRMCICKSNLIVLPLYIFVCVFELFLCVAFNGIPLISFGFLIAKAYCRQLRSYHAERRLLVRPLVFILTIILITFVMYFLFMFCTVFMDTTLLLCRVAMFTFTGIVIYPKVSYGYIIFAFTVIYYIWQSVQDFALTYDRLLRERANDRHRLVVKVGDLKGVNRALFEHVIERHYPRRKQVFVSVLKVTIILTILGLLFDILFEIDGFRDLHVIMHVGTALFICALPQIMKSMCRRTGDKFRHKRFQRELEESITTFITSNSYEELTSSDVC